MDHDSSFNKQFRKQIRARAVMNLKKTGMLKGDIERNDEKIDEISQEINKIKKHYVGEKRKIINIENFLWDLMS